jgi:hypothetical protein
MSSASILPGTTVYLSHSKITVMMHCFISLTRHLYGNMQCSYRPTYRGGNCMLETVPPGG